MRRSRHTGPIGSRSRAGLVVATAVALLVSPGLIPASYADPAAPQSPPAAPTLPDQASDRAQEALETAQALVETATDPAAPPTAAEDPTLVLATLAAAVPELDGSQRREAKAILARPDDAESDPIFAYDDRAQLDTQCTEHFCVHYATETSDRPPMTDDDGNRVPDWVERTGRVLERVWDTEIDEMGYRRPVGDRLRGNPAGEVRAGLVDVYLGDIGAQGYFGYAVAEDESGASYLVLDNDFTNDALVSKAGPRGLLKITSAHEFFHASQFGYDLDEDRWFMEATATWIEDEVFDGVNDNRIFLGSGVMTAPARSLDSPRGFTAYGNWVFFRHVSERFGPKIVRNMWWRAGKRHHHSTKAINRALRARESSFADTFSRFTSANTAPARHYEEGRAYPVAPVAKRFTLGPHGRSTGPERSRIRHLAARSYEIRPGPEARRGWRLRVAVDGPGRVARARVLVHRNDGSLRRRTVRLDRRGDGAVRVAFGRNKVQRVTVTLANGSIAYRCQTGGGFSCQGTPKRNKRPFELVARVVR